MTFGEFKLRMWKAARRITGRDVFSWRRKGDQARNHSDWDGAAAAYGRYLVARPGDAPIWVQLGHALRESGRLVEASAAYRKAADAGAADADLLLHQGRLARLQGDDATAARLFASSHRLDTKSAAAFELYDDRGLPHLAQALTAAGDPEPPRGRLEAARNGAATGWAIDPDAPDRPAEVEFLREGRVIGGVTADLPRPDLAGAGLSPGFGGFLFEFARSEEDDPSGWVLEARLKASGRPLSGSPCQVSSDDYLRQWLERERQERPQGEGDAGTRLSIVMPVFDPDPSWLDEAIASVVGQDANAWELICVDDGSTRAGVRDVLSRWGEADPRIRVITSASNIGIAAATNLGLAQATGDWVTFLDHDDRLEPEAVRRILAATPGEPELIYTDEAVTRDSISAVRGFSNRPAFSHDFYLSHPYFVHLTVVRRDIAIAVGGLDERLKISADVDFILRVLERARTVSHLPAVLYRWRTHAASQGHQAMASVTQTTCDAIVRHLNRLGQSDVRVSGGPVFNTYRIDRPSPVVRTLAIIPTRDRVDLLAQCLESLARTVPDGQLDIVVIDHESRQDQTREYLASLDAHVRILRYEGPFNFSRMNNEAVRRFGGGYDHLLFLNNDIEAHEQGWFERLGALCARPDVGVAGATLLYPDRRIQHAGVVIGLGGFAEHVYKFAPYELRGARNPGPGCALVSVRDVSAVTAACMMMRRDVFEQVGGFDEALAIGFNDTDICLRTSELGLRTLNDGLAVLTHHESATRRKSGQVLHPEDSARFAERWKDRLSGTDPYYSPFLSTDTAVGGEVHLCAEFVPRVMPGPAATRGPEGAA